MKSMPFLLLLFFSVLLTHAQQNVDSPKLSRLDSVGLQTFWDSFKVAISLRSKERLAGLCDFPFICGQCVDDTTIPHPNTRYVKVTRKLFDAGSYNIFLEEKLVAFVMQTSMPRDLVIFHPNTGTKGGYLFTYIIKTETNTQPGRQIFVYVNNIHGRYKITGTEVIP